MKKVRNAIPERKKRTFCTESIVNAANKNGNMAPINIPDKTTGSEILTFITPAFSVKAANSDKAVRTALPMAKPFPVSYKRKCVERQRWTPCDYEKNEPVAAVVLPKASSASVVSRTVSSSSAISAIPPALSAMGP